MRERFPDIFRRRNPPPLAIGIHKTILEVAGDDIDPPSLRWFLRFWVTRPDYWAAVARGDRRVNLDGSPAGLPTPEEQAAAAASLAARKK